MDTKIKSITEVNPAKAKFIGLFATSVVLCVVVSAAFWGSSSFPARTTESAAAENAGSSRYAGGPPANGSFAATDSNASHEQLNAALVSNAEKSLRASMDSIKASVSSGDSIQVGTTLALFREAIKNPRSISVISDVLSNRNKGGTASNEEVLKLKDDLLVKEGQLVLLQNQLKKLQKDADAGQPDVAKLKKDLQTREAQISTLQSQLASAPKSGGDPQAAVRTKEELQLKEAQINKLMTQLKSRPNTGNAGNLMAENKKLADENNFLKWAVRSEVSSNHNLSNLNTSLKQSNADLLNQVNTLKKSGKQ